MSEPVEKICVVGAGPAGLAAIAQLLETAKKDPSKKYEITLIEKRSLTDFKRRQKVIINPQTIIPGSKKETRWDEFCKQLFDPNNELKLDQQGRLLGANHQPIINLNKRQKFLRKLMQQREDFEQTIFRNFSIKDLQNALLEHIKDTNSQSPQVKIELHEETIITEVDIQNKQLTTNNNTSIPFDTLLICEGETRETTKKISEAIQKTEPKTKPFTYSPFSQQGNQYHCAVRLKLKTTKLACELDLNDHPRHKVKKQLRQLGWDSPGLPIFVAESNAAMFTLYDDKNPRLFIASEIPKVIYDCQDKNIKRKRIIEWAKILASYRFGIPVDEFDVDIKGEDTTHQLNATTFQSNMGYVDNPVRILPNGAQFILLGDAAISPCYMIGLSSTMALHQAMTTVDCLTTPSTEDNNRLKPLLRQYWLHKSFIETYSASSAPATPSEHPMDTLSSDFFTCVKENNIVAITKHLTTGMDPNIENESGYTALEIALQNNDLKMMEVLLSYGANPNHVIKNEDQTALFIAIKNTNLDAVKMLLAHGANANEEIQSITPVDIAIEEKNLVIINELDKHLIDGSDESKKVKKFLIGQKLLDSKERLNPLAFMYSSPTFFIDSNEYDNNFIIDYYDHNNRNSFLNTEHPPAHPKLIILYELLALQYLIEENKKSGQPIEEENIRKKELLDELAKPDHPKEEPHAQVLKIFGLFKEQPIEPYKTRLPYTDDIFSDLDKSNDTTYQQSINLFVNAMINRFIHKNEDQFESQLKECVSNDMILAMVELGKYYASKQRIDEAFSCFLKAASKGSSVAYIELASLLAQGKTNTLNLFHAYFLIDQGMKFSTVYLSCEHDNLYDRLENLENILQQKMHSDNDIVTYINSALDLAMAQAYREITNYTNNAETNTTLSKEKKSDYWNMLKLLKNLSKQYHQAGLVLKPSEFLTGVDIILENALSECRNIPTSSSFSDQLKTLRASIKNELLKKPEEENKSDRPTIRR